MILQAAHAVIVRRDEDQTILLESGLIAAFLQYFGRAFNCEALAVLLKAASGGNTANRSVQSSGTSPLPVNM